MKEKRNVLCNRIRSAKSWLNRAEDSFARQNDVQGELNLLLAQAELKHLQENQPSILQKNRHFIALFTALVIAFGGWNIFYNKDAQPVENNTLIVPMTKSFENDKIDLLKINKVQMQTADTAVTVEPVSAAQQENKFTQEIQQASAAAPVQSGLSESEMLELVRTAGQVLRSN